MDHDLHPNHHLKNQLDIYFLTNSEHWLSLAKPKNVFRLIFNPFIK